MPLKDILKHRRNVLHWLWTQALRSAAREQGLENLKKKLSAIVPDITDQYSNFKVDSAFLNEKVRNLHAFQIALAEPVINEFDSPTVVDIGDSSGTHLQYIVGLFSGDKVIRCLSVNLDSNAVERIQKKGIPVVCSRAEELQNYNIEADIFMCFETLEHLMNPCFFLHELSSKTGAGYLIVTVPYLKRSRVGLHHIRCGSKEPVNAEKTHIFELSPEDWKLIVRHSGWIIVSERVYRQYPMRGIFRLTKALWGKYDFEGFYGMVLKRDHSWSEKYTDW